MRCTLVLLAVGAIAASQPSAGRAAAADCPNGGTVRMGVEPFEAVPQLTPVYDQIGAAISANLGCKVEIYITQTYNAEIEAMRNGKLEFGEFGPLGYVLANKVATAQVIATWATADGTPTTYYASIVVPKGSPIAALKDVAGHTFAYSDPASTSGHLFPAYALKKAGIDPDNGVKAFYAGSHTASFEALRNKKVDAGELNSPTIALVTKLGEYTPDQYVTLWKSTPIPNDAFAVRGDLTPAFRQRLLAALLAVDFSKINDPNNVLKGLGQRITQQQDASYDLIRDMTATLNLDLTTLH
ncbi:MAG: phosphate/phosphite/phosphonate ABC transporter substrate-binding protein [Candidatus Eremiobacteraeota bacterium]|nr:phosphate/phosphite/phosphonate ABC transporter substrate-binding protein [Candidatus Eremiobacteraeota bacterium]